jgi:transcription antitermination factor NusG
MRFFESTSTSHKSAWFAIQVKGTHEKRVTALLEYQAYESFLPLYATRRRWSDRIKCVELPLFPGYVFSRFTALDRLSILKTPSVIGIVGIGSRPTPVDDKEIDAIQRAVKSGSSVTPHPYLKVGQTVRINEGCFEDVEGIIADVRGRDHLILSISLLQRSVAVEIDSASVTPIQRSTLHTDPAALGLIA